MIILKLRVGSSPSNARQIQWSKPLLLWALVLLCCATYSAAGVSCEAHNGVNRIARILAEVTDMELLAGELGFKRGTVNSIKENCIGQPNRFQCQWRNIVLEYCDRTGFELKAVVESVAQALERIQKKRQAVNLRDDFRFLLDPTPPPDQPPLPSPPPENEPFISVEAVTSKIRSFERFFDDMIEATFNELEGMMVRVNKLLRHITHLKHPRFRMKKTINTFLKENMNELYSSPNIQVVLGHLNRHWTYMQFDLLEHIIEQFGMVELERQMDKYKIDIEEFKRKTTVEEFGKANGKLPDPVIPDGFKELLSHHALSEQTTLSELEKLQRDIEKAFGLEDVALIVHTVMSGSVIVVWRIPESVADNNISMFLAREKQIFQKFESSRIMELELDGETIYQDTNLTSSYWGVYSPQPNKSFALQQFQPSASAAKAPVGGNDSEQFPKWDQICKVATSEVDDWEDLAIHLKISRSYVEGIKLSCTNTSNGTNSNSNATSSSICHKRRLMELCQLHTPTEESVHVVVEALGDMKKWRQVQKVMRMTPHNVKFCPKKEKEENTDTTNTSVSNADCDGEFVSRIADLLKGVTNYHRLFGELNIKMATVFEIQKNCRVYNTISEKCYRKKLVQMYCESTGSEALVVMHIAQALDSMDKCQQLAETIRKEIPIADLHVPSVARRRLRRSREPSVGVVEVVLSVVVAAVVLLLAVRVRYRNRVSAQVITAKTRLEKQVDDTFPCWSELVPHLGFSSEDVNGCSAPQSSPATTKETELRQWMTKEPHCTWGKLIWKMKDMGLDGPAAKLTRYIATKKDINKN